MNAIADYIETLELPAGGPFRTMPWQRRFLAGFEKSEGDAALSLGRGGGKTGLCAAIATAVADPEGPLHQPHGEVTCVASTHKQSTILFRDILHYLGAKYDLSNKEVWRVNNTINTANLLHRPSGTRVVCIGSLAGPAFGARSTLILCDEPASWEGGGDSMFSALRTGLGKKEGSRLVALGTRPADPHHWFATMLEGTDSRYRQVHKAGVTDPPFQKRTWLRANPSLPFMPALEKRIRLEAEDAKNDASLLPSFLALRLNLV